MLFLIAVAIAVLFSWCCAEPLRKRPVPFYIAGTLLSAIILILNQMHIQFPAFVNTYVTGLFQKGILPAALWCVVAWIGAIPDEMKEIRKKLIPSRGELSIFTALLTLSHAVIYSISYLQRLLNGRTDGNDFILTCLCCLALMLLMIPLTVMSFKAVRKKINGKTWKNLQKSAYLFYALIYLHIMIILIPKARSGREGVMLDIILYTIVFAGYAVCRIRKAVIRKNKTQKTVLLNSACMFIFLLFTGTIGFSSRAVNVPKVSAELEKTAETISVTETEIPSETDKSQTVPVESSAKLSTEMISTEIVSETSEPTTEISATETAASPAETTAFPETETATEKTTVQEENQQSEEIQEKNPVATETPVPEEPQEENPVATEAPVPEETPAPEPEQTEPETPAPPETIYQDGTYSVTKFGYDSDVLISVTIQNDIITEITASCNESDMYYFDTAYPVIRNAILTAQSPDVDAVSGATYSSNAIRDGVREALNQARK